MVPQGRPVIAAALAFAQLFAHTNALNITITKNETHDIPKTLFGYMWEDIQHSGDGGLYGELLQNRALQQVVPGFPDAFYAWLPDDGVTLNVTTDVPGVSSALPNSLQVGIPSTAVDDTGFSNHGFDGIRIQSGWTYNASLYVKSPSYTANLTVALVSATNHSAIYARDSVSGISNEWQQFTFQLTPTESAPDSNNHFWVSVDGSVAANDTLYFGLFSLFPPTWEGTPNGMRVDLAETLAATNPTIWRFPGGNNMEGNTIATRWKWNETIGPLENRPGRNGTWGYINTDGLGLMEYLNWAEALHAEPILGVWDGYALDEQVVAEDDLSPYIQSVVEEIMFITSPADANEWGALRAKYGREEPWNLTYVEIGNEDFISNVSTSTYQDYRWNMFMTNLSATFPNLTFLATTLPSTPLSPAYTHIDFHQYNAPSWFLENSFMFDNYPRNGTHWFIGEYAVTESDSGTNFVWPELVGSVAEAAFLTGCERNSDIVFATSYAPTLNNASMSNNLVTFNASAVVNSTSYYVQHLFSTHRGTQSLTTKPASDSSSAPLYWSASHNNGTGNVVLKIANAGNTPIDASFALDFNVTSTSGNVTSLHSASSNGSVFNTLDAPDTVVPVTSTFAMANARSFTYTFPAMSVSVLVIEAKEW